MNQNYTSTQTPKLNTTFNMPSALLLMLMIVVGNVIGTFATQFMVAKIPVIQSLNAQNQMSANSFCVASQREYRDSLALTDFEVASGETKNVIINESGIIFDNAITGKQSNAVLSSEDQKLYGDFLITVNLKSIKANLKTGHSGSIEVGAHSAAEYSLARIVIEGEDSSFDLYTSGTEYKKPIDSNNYLSDVISSAKQIKLARQNGEIILAANVDGKDIILEQRKSVHNGERNLFLNFTGNVDDLSVEIDSVIVSSCGI